MKKTILCFIFFILYSCTSNTRNDSSCSIFKIKKINDLDLLISFTPSISINFPNYFSLSLEEGNTTIEDIQKRQKATNFETKNKAIMIVFKEEKNGLNLLFYKESYYNGQKYNPFQKSNPVTSVSNKPIGLKVSGMSYMIMKNVGKGTIKSIVGETIKKDPLEGYQWIIHFKKSDQKKEYKLAIGRLRISLVNPGLDDLQISQPFTI